MIINFGGYRVTFSAGEEPVYLQIAWPKNTDPEFIHIKRREARFHARSTLAELCLIAVEQRQFKGITYELELYGRPAAYSAECVETALPEEIDI